MVVLSLAACGCTGSSSTAQTGAEDGATDDETDQTEQTEAEAEESEDDSPIEDLPSPWHCNPVSEPCPDGEKCTIVWQPEIDSKCVPIHEDPVAVGEACEELGDGLDNCPDHAACVSGECRGICDEESGQGCPEGQLCGWNNSTNFTAFCHVPCHPLELTDCDPDETCVPSNVWTGFECAGAGAGLGQNESCRFPLDCAAGLVCVHVDDEPLCKAFCSLMDGGCADTDVCVPWYDANDAAPPGYEDIGVCLPP